MPAPATSQRNITVYLRRKPPAEHVATAKGKGHAPPPATPLGTFQVPYDGVDQAKEAARKKAAEFLKVAPSKLTVSMSPDGDLQGVPQHKILVYAPPEGA